MPDPIVLKGAAASDIGRRRKHNEDAILVREDLGLYAVADGAGGHNSGEVASALALRSMENYFGATIRKTHDLPEVDKLGIPSGARRLSSAVHKANRDIIDVSKSRPEHKGMGTTVVALSFSPRSGMIHVAHVGDSRCYRLRGGHLELLTQDHSLLTDVIEQRPELDDSVMERLPKNVVTRALGLELDLRVALRTYAVATGDRYLLCSDGMSGPVPTETIAALLLQPDPPEALVAQLVLAANDAGGPDNIGVAVVDCMAGPTRAVPHYVPPPPPAIYEMARQANASSEPDLLILGIEEFDLLSLVDTASDDLLRALEQLVDKK
ncbi:MAG TPA: protein phosphatase 2C domain-containing protein [Polyangiaceae bacterium]|nr:protein phosphatase 2C domain-containing protein [Polyangiaceae bacterium]